MIQARENLVWVANAAGHLEAFDEQRLAESVRRAGGSDEEEARDVAEAIAGAVYHYVREHARDRLVTVAEIGEMVQALLAMLGYDETSERYSGQSARTEIRLDEVAAAGGAGFELAFFRELDVALSATTNGELRRVRLSGLRACVLQLRGTRRWSVACRRLAEEILGYVYARTICVRPRAATALQVEVVE